MENVVLLDGFGFGLNTPLDKRKVERRVKMATHKLPNSLIFSVKFPSKKTKRERKQEKTKARKQNVFVIFGIFNFYIFFFVTAQETHKENKAFQIL